MTHSLNELAALVKLSAKGAGYSWGMAEEASYAVRWLAAANLPAPQILACILNHQSIAHRELAGPQIDNTLWIAGKTPMCPLRTGAALSDFASVLSTAGPIDIGPVNWPVALLPFICLASQSVDDVLSVSWGGLYFECRQGVLAVNEQHWSELQHQALSDQSAHVSCQLSVTQHQRPLKPIERLTLRAEISEDCLAELKSMAARTYAPATEASRISGAGAGTTDND